MSEKIALQFRNYNPDVLTCIANLSNDEVFTPPEFANRMLDTLEQAWAEANGGASIWADPDVTFLDPFTKSGVFLREITRRLTDGLAEQIPDLQERVDHILTKQVYGIAITRLTSLLARRSLYCSKWANGPHSIARSFDTEEGNIWFERTEHTWAGGRLNHTLLDADGNPVVDGRRCRYCGASEDEYRRGDDLETHAYAFIHTDDIKARVGELFGADMQFDVILGNPPYQLDDGGFGSSAAPIYHEFVLQAKALEPRMLSMVIPARWYAGGKGLTEFRNAMLDDARIRVLDDYPSTMDVFPGVNNRGGICTFLWERDYRGDVLVRTHERGVVTSEASRPLLEHGAETFIRYNEGIEILRKVAAVEGAGGADGIALPASKRFSTIVSSRKPFGLPTNFKGRATRRDNDLLVYRNGGTAFVSRDDLTAGFDLIDATKLFVPYASPGSDEYPHLVLSRPLVAESGEVATETYAPPRLLARVERRRPRCQVRTHAARPRVHGPVRQACGVGRRLQMTTGELLPAKPTSRLRIYAWAPKDPPPLYQGLIKVGQTTQADVNVRIRQSQGQMQQPYTLHVDVVAERDDGTPIRDGEVRQRLIEKGFENVVIGASREWMRCAPADVLSAITELRKGLKLSKQRYETFPMREEQRAAVEKAAAFIRRGWAEDSVPEFLWNAKMRFGKTFTAYQLAREIGAHRVLVMTFKPAVEDAWDTDLATHVDFEGWQYYSRKSGGDPVEADPDRPMVYFGSFQDLMGKDAAGNFKARHAWMGDVTWDLVVFDEYHFGAWRDAAKELFEGEDEKAAKKELDTEFNPSLEVFEEQLEVLENDEDGFIALKAKAYLYLSGTPFKALATGRFIEDQIFNWTYTDEQRAKAEFAAKHPDKLNPYGALPEMRLFTYKMPDELLAVASGGEHDEFDLNAFFEAKGEGSAAEFVHKEEVQKWLDLIRGARFATQVDALKTGEKPPLPYSDIRLLPYLQHSIWMLPRVNSCMAMENLLAEPQNAFWHDYTVVNVSAPGIGIGLDALPPVRKAIRNGHDTKTITLTVGKLTTGVTVAAWSSILMLRNLKAPETYFQAAFRVQSPWSIKNPNGDNPNEESILKPVCFVFDFAPTRALRQISEYGIGLAPEKRNPEEAVRDLVQFLPVLAYDGANMAQVDAGEILDIAMAGTSATLLARKWESAILVNVDNATLKKIMADPAAMDAVMNIEGFRALGSSVFETVVNKSEALKETKKQKQGQDLTPAEKRQLSDEEKEYKSKRKQIQEKLIKFATRIPAFMYLTDFREHTLRDVITEIEPELFKSVTGLSVSDFNLLVSLGVFNAAHMNQAVFAFRRYEDASLRYTGIDSHENLTHYGLYDTVIAVEEENATR